MDDVVAHPVAQGKKRHFGGKFGKVLEKLAFVDRFRGTGVDGNYANLVAGGLDFRGLGIGASGKYIDGKTEGGDMAAQLTNVNVHAARVLAAKVGERRGVNRDRRDPVEDVSFVSENRRSLVTRDRHKNAPSRRRHPASSYRRGARSPKRSAQFERTRFPNDSNCRIESKRVNQPGMGARSPKSPSLRRYRTLMPSSSRL